MASKYSNLSSKMATFLISALLLTLHLTLSGLALPKNSKKHGRSDKNLEDFDGDVFSTSRSTGVICKLCIIVDDEFLRTYGQGKGKTLLGRLHKLVDSVEWTWRSVDWNGDKFPDNIGFKIARTGWKPYGKARGYNISRPAMALLAELAQVDFSNCCLGLGFTMRPFLEKQVGLTFTASLDHLGGICDTRTPESNLKSTNIILITAKGLSGYPLSSTDLQLVLLHELGHAFGAQNHDNEILIRQDSSSVDFRECSGHPMSDVKNVVKYSDDYFLQVEPAAGRFVMWSENKQGRRALKWNNLQFSSCSKTEVAQILRGNRGFCFVQDRAPYCGNNIVEHGEECDCGNQINCALIACCGSRNSKRPCKRLPTVKGDLSRPCTTKHKYPLGVKLGPQRRVLQSVSSVSNIVMPPYWLLRAIECLICFTLMQFKVKVYCLYS